MGNLLGVSGKYVGMLEREEKDVEEASSIVRLLALYEQKDEAGAHVMTNGLTYSGIKEPAAHYRAHRGPRLSPVDAMAQARADLNAIERGTPEEQRRAFVFLRDVHLPLIAEAFNIES